ncbi:hypothetical protein ABZV14_05315 [Streptosporangium canum]|uniref:hypothetical protein n=1 Tax=Streptosporangium canum TaxID=324952 RepID=UPI0033B796FE
MLPRSTRKDIDKLGAVLLYRHGWKKARLGRAACISPMNLFSARVTLPEPLDDFVLTEVEAQLTDKSPSYRQEQERAKAAREIRRDDVVALYQGHIDGRRRETPDIAQETGMSDNLVKADLIARQVELRPAKGQRAATLDRPAAPLPDIARMLRAAPNKLKPGPAVVCGGARPSTPSVIFLGAGECPAERLAKIHVFQIALVGNLGDDEFASRSPLKPGRGTWGVLRPMSCTACAARRRAQAVQDPPAREGGP